MLALHFAVFKGASANMTANWQRGLRKLRIACLLSAGGALAELSVGTAFSGNRAIAQITPDRTLGAESSVITPLKPQVDRIDGGAMRGSNLFHSFQDFNIGEGRGAYFANPAGIENIFSRVTGRSPSHLFGTLGVFGNGNLFFLNPNGIIFGSNAKLDIRGSFVASTASSVAFPDGKIFSATNPQAPPLLTVNVPVPIGLEFETEPGPIANAGNLRVGTNLTLVGGTVASTGQLSAPSGEVAVSTVPNVGVNKGIPIAQLGKAGQLLNVQMRSPTSGSSQPATPVLSLAELLAGGGVETGLSVNSSGQVELTGSGIAVAPGDIAVRQLDAQKVTLSATQNLTLVESQLRTSGDMHLLARDTVRVQDSATIPFIAEAGGKLLLQGDRGVDIFALNHKNSGFFSGGDMVLRSANTIGGDAHYYAGGNFRIEQLDGSLGNLSSPYDPIIQSLGDVSFNSYSGASLHILAAGQVNIGQVTITGAETGTLGNDYLNETLTLSNSKTVVPVNGSAQPTLDVRAGVDPAAISNPGGATGKGLLDIFDNIPLFGNPAIASTATSADINIDSITIKQPNGLVLLTNQYKPNTKLSGNIQVGTIRVDDKAGGLLGGFTGNGGDVFFDSRGNITIPSSGEIKTDSSTGNAGDITLIARNSISLLDKVKVGSNTRGADNSGNINIEAGALSMTGGASLDTSTFGQGNAGDINIDVRDAVSLAESQIYSNVEAGAVANGSDISIKAESLSLTQGSQLGSFVASASNNLPSGRGNAGNVSIDIRDTITIAGRDGGGYPSGIFAASDSKDVSNAGNIDIKAGTLLMDTGAVGAYTFGQGNGGNISVKVDGAISLTNISSIWTNVESEAKGNAGNIEIKAGSLQLNNSASLQASTAGEGNAGNISIVDTSKLNISDGGQILTLALGNGNGGNLSINGTKELNISNGGQILTGTSGKGKGGNLSIKDTGSVNLVNNGLLATTSLGGAAGGILIDVQNLSVRDASKISSATAGAQTGGDFTVKAANSVEVVNDSQLAADTINSGSAGNLTVETRNFTVGDRSLVSAGTLGSGQGGNLRIQASDSVKLENKGIITTSSTGTGGAGNLDIETGRLDVQDTSAVITNTTGSGAAGNLTVKTTNSVNVSNNSKLSTDTLGSGKGGDLTVDTGSLRIQNNSTISSSTTNSGDAGNLKVQASDSVSVDSQSGISTFSTGTGAAGDLFISAKKLSVRDDSLITTSTLGSKNAGNLAVQATDLVELVNRSVLSSGTLGSGNGGDLAIATRNLSLANNSAVLTSTTSSGRGGNLKVQASDSVNLDNESGITTSSTDTGAAGNLSLETGRVSLRNRSGLATTTLGSSNAGDLMVKAADSVEVVDGSRLLADTRSSGNGGNLIVQTDKFSIRNNSEVSAGTASSGRGGTVKVEAYDFVEISNSSGLFTSSAGSGHGGNMTVDTRRLIAKDGGRVEAGTTGIAPGGNLTIYASESIDLSGSSAGGVFRSGLSAYSLAAGNARSGDLNIATGQLHIRNGAEVTVTSFKGQAGNINVAADSVSLNRGRITAETRLGEGEGGANINLRLAGNLFLTNESLVSATAFDAANGGNVTINAQFLIAFPPIGPEGSDIIANAYLGNGGRVNVSAQRLFDIDFRKRRTPLNDITASSEFGNPGVVAIDELGIDPNRGLANLPGDPGNVEVRDGCQASVGQADVAFYNIGRGGLPPRPDEPFHADTLVTDWILFEPEIGKKPEAKNTINLFDSDKKTLARVSNWDSEESHTAKTPNFSTQLSPLCQRVKQFQFAK